MTTWTGYLQCLFLGKHTEKTRKLWGDRDHYGEYRFGYKVICFYCKKSLSGLKTGGYRTTVEGDYGRVKIFMYPYGFNENWSIRDVETGMVRMTEGAVESMELAKKLVMDKEFGDEFRKSYRDHFNNEGYNEE